MRRNLAKNWLIRAMLLGIFALVVLEAHGVTCQKNKQGECPLCGQPWRARVDPEMGIPENLPTPRNRLFIDRLRRVLVLEKLAKGQYEADQKRFGVTSPYRYVLPQIEQHIGWIEKLFAAYGLKIADGEIPSLKKPDTVLKALKNGKKMEEELVREYRWLFNYAEDKTTKRVLNIILSQTSIHLILFENDIHIIEIEGSMAPLLL